MRLRSWQEALKSHPAQKKGSEATGKGVESAVLSFRLVSLVWSSGLCGYHCCACRFPWEGCHTNMGVRGPCWGCTWLGGPHFLVQESTATAVGGTDADTMVQSVRLAQHHRGPLQN